MKTKSMVSGEVRTISAYSFRLAGLLAVTLCLQSAWADKEGPVEQAVPGASTLDIRLAEGQSDTISEWEDAHFEAVLIDPDGTTLDVTDSPNLTWSASCGGSFEGGTFTPLAVNQSLACDITATFSAEDDEPAGDTITIEIVTDRCRNGRPAGQAVAAHPGLPSG